MFKRISFLALFIFLGAPGVFTQALPPSHIFAQAENTPPDAVDNLFFVEEDMHLGETSWRTIPTLTAIR